MLALLIGMIKHFESTLSNKFARSLQYLKREVWNGVHFLYADIVTRKEIVWKKRNFFCLCSVPALISAQSFRKGTKSRGSFNNISLNKNFWKKYNLRQPTLCFKISQGVT